MINRNVEGLKENAQKKREECFVKVEKSIQQLLKEGAKINFNSVVRASGVSKAWLYKEPEIKQRIEKLREQYGNSKKVAHSSKSDASKDALIKTIKARNKSLIAENKALKTQIETVYGQLVNQKELRQKIQRLEKENQSLKDRLFSPVENSNSVPDNSKGIDERILHELAQVGITLSSTLAKQIRGTSSSVIITAIEALKQQIDTTLIRSPEAWLSAAIRDSWQPNEAKGESKSGSEDNFSVWYELAKAYGVVTQCSQEDSSWNVRDNTGQWHSYEEFSSRWTLDYLKGVVKLQL